LFVFALFNFQGPLLSFIRFRSFVTAYLSYHTSKLLSRVFSNFFQSFFGGQVFIQVLFSPKTLCLCGFLALFFALSCDSFVIIPLTSPFVNSFFQTFFFFYKLYIFCRFFIITLEPNNTIRNFLTKHIVSKIPLDRSEPRCQQTKEGLAPSDISGVFY